MSQKTIYLVLGLIIVVLIITASRGFSILKTEKQAPPLMATTTIGIPDNLSISEEIGG